MKIRILLIFGLLISSILLLTGCERNYHYVGYITNIEGGSSNSVIILTLNTIGKTPYTFSKDCSNKIRIGQNVYSADDSDYLWVEYETGKFC